MNSNNLFELLNRRQNRISKYLRENGYHIPDYANWYQGHIIKIDNAILKEAEKYYGCKFENLECLYKKIGEMNKNFTDVDGEYDFSSMFSYRHGQEMVNDL